VIRLAMKRQLGKLWRAVRPTSQHVSSQRGIVILYHAVGASRTSISAENFREQIVWLATHTNVVGIDTMASGAWPDSDTEITSAITFDDGYAGVHEIALPILREFNCAATVYVSTNTIDMHEKRSSTEYAGLYPNELLLNWMQLRELSKNGFSIGSHLMSHYDLTLLPQGEADAQLQGSKSKIEDVIGKPCTSFAYPWGKHSQSAVEAVRHAGYGSAVIAMHHSLQRNTVDPLRVPRADIQHLYTLDDFKSIVCGDWDYLGHYQQLRKNRKY
jgi:peptidoglycan/xylan/chitin deacetylase (PgdA/CDA1 family)